MNIEIQIIGPQIILFKSSRGATFNCHKLKHWQNKTKWRSSAHVSVWKAADDIQTGHCYQRDFSVVQCPLPLSLVAGPLRALALSAKGKVKNWCLAVTGCCRLRHPPADESICSLIWVARQRFMADRPQFSHRFLPLSITTSSGSKPFFPFLT